MGIAVETIGRDIWKETVWTYALNIDWKNTLIGIPLRGSLLWLMAMLYIIIEINE